MAPTKLKIKGNKAFSLLSTIDTDEDLSKTWRLMTKVKDALEYGMRLENLSWRLWFIHHLTVHDQKTQSQFKKLSTATTKKLETDKATNLQKLTAPSYRPKNSSSNNNQDSNEQKNNNSNGNSNSSNHPHQDSNEKKNNKKKNAKILQVKKTSSQRTTIKSQKIVESIESESINNTEETTDMNNLELDFTQKDNKIVINSPISSPPSNHHINNDGNGSNQVMTDSMDQVDDHSNMVLTGRNFYLLFYSD